MTFILYDRYFSLDESTGKLKTFWRVIGNKYNSVVQLHETYPVQTLNCYDQNISSLYIFCKLTQYSDFEKHQLVDLHKQFGNNMKIFKFQNKLTISSSSSSVLRNFDNIQSIFMMHTRANSKMDTVNIKEPISHRYVYKICFNTEKTRNDLVSKLKFFNLTSYPDIEMFIPFYDECELILNHVFPTNRHNDNTKYTYLTVITNHYMNFIPIIESFHGIIQLINSRTISHNTLVVNNREVVTNTKTLADIFLENVPIVDFFLGRVYENEQCMEFNSDENEITFLMIKIYIFKHTHYVVYMNRKYQKVPIHKDAKLNNIILCENERDLLLKFFNMYTNGLLFKILNMDIHFIMSTQRYKSNSYILMHRIIYNKFWDEFSSHCVISEDGKCVRFNRNSIILFDNISKSDSIVTNFRNIDKDIYLPELYGDSTMPIDSSLCTHLQNIKPGKTQKYSNINYENEVTEMSLYELIYNIFKEEDSIDNQNYNDILESVIELSNKIRIPITLLYSLSVAQIAYRLIFYTQLRNGVFPIIDKDEGVPAFYQTHNNNNGLIINCLKTLSSPQNLKIFQNVYDSVNGEGQKNSMFTNLIKKYIPIHMTGNLLENYFSFFCPSSNQFPLMSSLTNDESELLSHKNAIIWSRVNLYNNRSIVSFDFSLFNSSIISIFGLDFQNCAILLGFELKNFFYSIYPDRETFEENKLKTLQLPNMFIMDNDSLKIYNIEKFENISNLNDGSCYIVIMRFVTTDMMKKYDKNYLTLSEIFYSNIMDMKKYKTRLLLHKNILNAICGMLSTYQINTKLLNIVNALSRKIMLWIVSNYCQNDTSDIITFIQHEYDPNETPPENLISIENDSFTFVYDYAALKYEYMETNLRVVNNLKDKILRKLCTELTTCTLFDFNEIFKIFNLKINFITGNILQLSSRKFFYINQTGENLSTLKLDTNEKNNRVIQKALSYMNNDVNFIRIIVKNKPIKLSYLKNISNFTDIRKLLIWYMLQHSRVGIQNEQHRSTFQNLETLETFLNRSQEETRKTKTGYLNLLFNIVQTENIEDNFLNILSSPLVNLNFATKTIPDFHTFRSIHLPSDKRTLIINCVLLFFKFFKNY